LTCTADTVLRHFQDTDIDNVPEWLEYIDAISSLSVDPKHMSRYKGSFGSGRADSRRDSYCEHAFSEAFCASYWRCVFPTLLHWQEWLAYGAGILEEEDRNCSAKMAREVIHPSQVQARRIMDILSSVESAKQVPLAILWRLQDRGTEP